MTAIQAYIRKTAPAGRETERIGPFLATYSIDTAHPMLNYAIPDDDASPSAAEIAQLTEAYRRRRLLPRLEFFTETAPGLEALLTASGYVLERRVALMTCTPADLREPPMPPGITVREPADDAEFRRMRSVQNVAYGEPPEVPETETWCRRHLTLLAADTTTGEVVGGGTAVGIVDRTTEVAGIAVASHYRGRGIAGALTARLTAESHRRGAATAFLTPGDSDIQRVYARIGYHPAGECVHLSRPST